MANLNTCDQECRWQGRPRSPHTPAIVKQLMWASPQSPMKPAATTCAPAKNDLTPRPDGQLSEDKAEMSAMTAEFFQIHWDVYGGDVTKVVLSIVHGTE